MPKPNQSVILSGLCLVPFCPVLLIALVHHLYDFLIYLDHVLLVVLRPFWCLVPKLLLVLTLVHLLVFLIVLHSYVQLF